MSAIAASPPPLDPGLSDEELMGQLAAGRQEALGPLHGRYATMVFNLAARTLDRATAEEVVQDVFVAVWRKAGTFDPARGTFRAWVFAIARNTAIDRLRKKKISGKLLTLFDLLARKAGDNRTVKAERQTISGISGAPATKRVSARTAR